MSIDYNIQEAGRAAAANHGIAFLNKPKKLQQALNEASRPLLAHQQRIRDRVVAKGLVYAVNGDGSGCVFKK